MAVPAQTFPLVGGLRGKPRWGAAVFRMDLDCISLRDLDRPTGDVIIVV